MSKEICPRNTKRRVHEVQVAECVIARLRAGRSNTENSEHTQTFRTGHGEEGFVDWFCEFKEFKLNRKKSVSEN